MVVPGAHRPTGGGAAGPIRPCMSAVQVIHKKTWTASIVRNAIMCSNNHEVD